MQEQRWEPYLHGRHSVLHDPLAHKFKCPRPSCGFVNASPQSVVVHKAQHCRFKEEQIPIDGTPQQLEALRTSVGNVPDVGSSPHNAVNVDVVQHVED